MGVLLRVVAVLKNIHFEQNLQKSPFILIRLALNSCFTPRLHTGELK